MQREFPAFESDSIPLLPGSHFFENIEHWVVISVDIFFFSETKASEIKGKKEFSNFYCSLRPISSNKIISFDSFSHHHRIISVADDIISIFPSVSVWETGRCVSLLSFYRKKRMGEETTFKTPKRNQIKNILKRRNFIVSTPGQNGFLYQNTSTVGIFMFPFWYCCRNWIF